MSYLKFAEAILKRGYQLLENRLGKATKAIKDQGSHYRKLSNEYGSSSYELERLNK